jgi:hypothetical protein
MAEIVQPNNPLSPPADNSVITSGYNPNLSSLLNPNTLQTLNSSNYIQSFGDQAQNQATQRVIRAANDSPLVKLYKVKALLIQEGIELEIEHQISLQKIEYRHTPKKQYQNGQTVDIPSELNDEEYQNTINNENKNYNDAKKNLQERKDQNEKDIEDFLKDPFKKQKEERRKRKENRKKRKTRTKEEKRKARKVKSKLILKNAKKSLAPVLILALTNKIAEIVAENEQIKRLIDSTNNLITAANEANAVGNSKKLEGAKLARNVALSVINSNEEKIRKFNDEIGKISIYISIFSVIVNIISSIPIPTSVPPGVGVPISLIMTFVKLLDKANRILLTLSAVLPILQTVLEKAIDILEDYKSQLLDVNGKLEIIASTGANSTLSLLDNNIKLGILEQEYKGFKFAIKEEQTSDLKYNVRGFKRHYAIALDADGVEVLKSELSFTLDPNDLVSQLKLTIDDRKMTSVGSGRTKQNTFQTNNPPEGTVNNGFGNLQTYLPSSSSIQTAQKAINLPQPPPEWIRAGLLIEQVPIKNQNRKKYLEELVDGKRFPKYTGEVGDARTILTAEKVWIEKYKKWQQSVSAGLTGIKF